MKIYKRKDLKPTAIQFEWFDKTRGHQSKTVSFDEVKTTLEISPRTLERRLTKNNFSKPEQKLLALACCGRLDQIGKNWTGFYIDKNEIVSPLRHSLASVQIEQYAFLMSCHRIYSVELKEAQKKITELKEQLSNYSEENKKIVPFTNQSAHIA